MTRWKEISSHVYSEETEMWLHYAKSSVSIAEIYKQASASWEIRSGGRDMNDKSQISLFPQFPDDKIASDEQRQESFASFLIVIRYHG